MTNNGSALDQWFSGGAVEFDRSLEGFLGEASRLRPARLIAAMRHAVFAGGKRLRPYLVLNSARLFGVEEAVALRTAAALEFIHCYSLVHDDLPAMDDDDMRRGQPTVHVAFDEATAILAGDGLLTLAFSVLASRANPAGPTTRAHLIEALAAAAGIDGMVAGQMLDLDAEGRFDGGVKRLTLEDIAALQALKTGALIRFAAESGALMAGGRGARRRVHLARFGAALGLAFQIRDDLIDVEVDAATAGKATGKDDKAGKGTFVSLLGLNGARARLDRATEEGLDALRPFGAEAEALRIVLLFNRTRQS